MLPTNTRLYHHRTATHVMLGVPYLLYSIQHRLKKEVKKYITLAGSSIPSSFLLAKAGQGSPPISPDFRSFVSSVRFTLTHFEESLLLLHGFHIIIIAGQSFKMPKDIKAYDKQFSRKNRLSCHHPYNSPEKTIIDGSSSEDISKEAQKNQWDNTVCLICLEHPHNAVLLQCTSYDKGCRPYICDTSSRHSNCLDQYRKPRSACRNSSSQGIELYIDRRQVEAPDFLSHGPLETGTNTDRMVHTSALSSPWIPNSLTTTSEGISHGLSHLRPDSRYFGSNGRVMEGGTVAVSSSHNRNGTETLVNDSLDLKCPLCRGDVTGWKVIEPARKYLNLKARACSHESCTFNGNYMDLRKHARREHPTAKPTEVDPARQRAWRDSELSRDFDDMLSSIHSAMPDGVVFGDYIIENDDGIHDEDDIGHSSLTATSGSWWTRFFLVHMFGPIAALADSRRFSARWRASRRQHDSLDSLSGRSLWWGEWGEDRVGSGDDSRIDDFTFGASGSRSRRQPDNSEPDNSFP